VTPYKFILKSQEKFVGLVWLTVAMVCPSGAPRVKLFVSAGNGWRIMCHGVISSWQSAASTEIVKRFYRDEFESRKQHYTLIPLGKMN